jgi:hypothetical protein
MAPRKAASTLAHVPERMLQTCAGDAATTMLAEMLREFMPVTSMSTATSDSAAESAAACCCMTMHGPGRAGAARSDAAHRTCATGAHKRSIASRIDSWQKETAF